ncbi:hypothetical protein KY348_05920 [Candidatus Woesearchaeota archaeon]|nr:hypothetical protein [Candidatus Woesearchaeota archaeon]
MIYEIHNAEPMELDTIVLDLNGTLAVNGVIPKGVPEKLEKLRKLGFKILLFTGNVRNDADKLCGDLGIEYKIALTSDDKEKLMKKLGISNCVAIGNARADIGTFKHAKLSILTLQAEGIHTGAIEHVDVIVPSINDAFDFLLSKATFNATMRE